MSLKDKLNKTIHQRGYITYEEMEAICKENGYRTETGRRALEKDHSPNIEHVMGKTKQGRDYTKGYRFVGKLSPREKLKLGIDLSTEEMTYYGQ